MNFALTTILTSSATAGFVVWLLREWIGTRIKESIKNEYDTKLETHKATLAESYSEHLLKLQSQVDQGISSSELVVNALLTGQKAVMERKLQSIETLWGQILHVKKETGAYLTFIDVLYVTQYQGSLNNPKFRDLFGDINLKSIMKGCIDRNGPLATNRLYSGEHLWALAFAYQAICLRICMLLVECLKDPKSPTWNKDEHLRKILSDVLGASSLSEFDKQETLLVSWIQNSIETKFLETAGEITSGKTLSKDAHAQANEIMKSSMAAIPRS
ncbi:hypothetical protein H5P28_14160 [Ruficoccus amylovorans]|uniref:Uncharacterized protein n=1 Tax=Ruficoccus amylovorans TaxID=1804625 RepID=A0A842HHD8_9BACT|nr:hypothetical protein [Ruficoccus amylovorans]MBC2595408.1 hypothetical protein [Ruficoccus amylovorans]